MADDSYYGYNPHTDVETLTKENGDTKATYGYTAFGSDDKEAFTGIDKPDVQQPGKEPYNFYRYNGKRFDPSSGSYDMGFRDYNPGLNRFMTRDMYNGALADMHLGSDPFTGNRYAFVGGNPITGVELDGHRPEDEPGYCLGYLGDCGIDPTAGSTVQGSYSPQQLSSMGVLTYQQPQRTVPAPTQRPPAPVAPPAAPPTGNTGRLGGLLGLLLTTLTADSAEPQMQERRIDTARGTRDCEAEGPGTVGYIIYHNLDQHGRATGAEACLKGRVADLDDDARFTPPGFKAGMDRGHLIARMFGGSNTKPENFVPLYPNANQIQMKAIENEIAARVNRGETVYYAVTPSTFSTLATRCTYHRPSTSTPIAQVA